MVTDLKRLLLTTPGNNPRPLVYIVMLVLATYAISNKDSKIIILNLIKYEKRCYLAYIALVKKLMINYY